MSALQQMAIAGKSLTSVSGSVSGAGNLNIPAGVTRITLTGQGGAGTAASIIPLSTAHLVDWQPYGLTDAAQNNIPSQVGWQDAGFGPPPNGGYSLIDTIGDNTHYSWNNAPEVIAVYQRNYLNTSDSNGAPSSASFQGQTKVWMGATLGVASYPPSSQQIMTALSGASGSLSYNCAPGTLLYYAYTY